MPDNGLTRGEKGFVGAVSVVVFVISVAFVATTVFAGYGFPATFVAISLGISIASLVYAFLGGVAGSEFSVVSGIKIAGSAALIAIVFWLVAGPLEKNMNDVKAIATGKAAERQIAEEQRNTTLEHAARVKAEQQLRLLQADTGIKQSDTDAGILARLRQSTAKDDLGRGALKMEQDHQGPWRADLLKLNARFIQEIPTGTFRFCHDKRPELQDAQAQFELVDPESGTSKKINLKAGGDIGPGACQIITFDVQLGCDAAKELLGVECDDRRGVGWQAPADNHAYNLVASVTSPTGGQ